MCRVCSKLIAAGRKVVAIRHPMPYGDLVKQRVQRFAVFEDLDRAQCTIEEREEYEPHIKNGVVVYAGVDYAAILAEAEREADVIVWDGGNNDLPFYRPDESRNRQQGGGAGLGLAIVKDCIEACRGTVVCRNRLGRKGLEVEFTLKFARNG